MNFVVLIMSVGLPIAMALGGYAAWQIAKTESRPEANKAAWKDDSLDDWRRERDVRAEEARSQRGDVTAEEERTGSTEEQEETRRHQRIGG